MAKEQLSILFPHFPFKDQSFLSPLRVTLDVITSNGFHSTLLEYF